MSAKVLVPLDGSALSERALPYAEAIAKGMGDGLSLLFVRSAYLSGHLSDVDLAPLAERLRARGVIADVITYELFAGDTGKVIADAATGQQAELIVMSTHGRSGVGRWVYGSVADQTLRQASVPVVLIPSACEVNWETRGPRRILVGVDGSGLSEQSLQLAARFARSSGAEVLVLRVVEPVNYVVLAGSGAYLPADDPEAEVKLAGEYVASVAEKMRDDGVSAIELVEVGPAASTIVDTAREQGADLIVMATHGRGGLARLVMGSVATGVLQRANTPIMLFRPHGVARVVPTDEPVAASALTLDRSELEVVDRGLAILLESQSISEPLRGRARALLERVRAAVPSSEATASHGGQP